MPKRVSYSRSAASLVPEESSDIVTPVSHQGQGPRSQITRKEYWEYKKTGKKPTRLKSQAMKMPRTGETPVTTQQSDSTLQRPRNDGTQVPGQPSSAIAIPATGRASTVKLDPDIENQPKNNSEGEPMSMVEEEYSAEEHTPVSEEVIHVTQKENHTRATTMGNEDVVSNSDREQTKIEEDLAEPSSGLTARKRDRRNRERLPTMPYTGRSDRENSMSMEDIQIRVEAEEDEEIPLVETQELSSPEIPLIQDMSLRSTMNPRANTEPLFQIQPGVESSEFTVSPDAANAATPPRAGDRTWQGTRNQHGSERQPGPRSPLGPRRNQPRKKRSPGQPFALQPLSPRRAQQAQALLQAQANRDFIERERISRLQQQFLPQQWIPMQTRESIQLPGPPTQQTHFSHQHPQNPITPHQQAQILQADRQFSLTQNHSRIMRWRPSRPNSIPENLDQYAYINRIATALGETSKAMDKEQNMEAYSKFYQNDIYSRVDILDVATAIIDYAIKLYRFGSSSFLFNDPSNHPRGLDVDLPFLDCIETFMNLVRTFKAAADDIMCRRRWDEYLASPHANLAKFYWYYLEWDKCRVAEHVRIARARRNERRAEPQRGNMQPPVVVQTGLVAGIGHDVTRNNASPPNNELLNLATGSRGELPRNGLANIIDLTGHEARGQYNPNQTQSSYHQGHHAGNPYASAQTYPHPPQCPTQRINQGVNVLPRQIPSGMEPNPAVQLPLTQTPGPTPQILDGWEPVSGQRTGPLNDEPNQTQRTPPNH